MIKLFSFKKLKNKKKTLVIARTIASRLLAQRHRQGFLASVTWVRALVCTPVTLAVSYLPIGLAECSVDPRISCDARKLARTTRVTKKKKKNYCYAKATINVFTVESTINTNQNVIVKSSNFKCIL
jgi:hypothetical protein